MLYAIIGIFSLFLGYVNHKHSSAFVALGPRPCGATPSTKMKIRHCPLTIIDDCDSDHTALNVDNMSTITELGLDLRCYLN